MKDFRFLFIIALFNCLLGFSQKSGEYVGAIKLNDSSIITYKVNIKINGSKVEGFSVTDFGGEHETKSNIVGQYDEAKKKLAFNEIGIIYTKSPVTQKDFCFIHFQPVDYKVGKTSYFKGDFKGLFSDGKECISGEIFLNSVENVNEKMAKVSKKINNSNRVPDSVKVKFNNLNLMDKVNTNLLKASKTLSVFTKSKTINLELYDGGQEDGDIVSIKVGDKMVLDNFTVTSKKKILTIDLINDKTSIVLIAKNVGTISTNTAVIEINDSENNIKALTNLKEGETTQIDVLRKK